MKQNVIYIRKEEDELICLRKELQNLVEEKQLLNSGIDDKVKKLASN